MDHGKRASLDHRVVDQLKIHKIRDNQHSVSLVPPEHTSIEGNERLSLPLINKQSNMVIDPYHPHHARKLGDKAGSMQMV